MEDQLIQSFSSSKPRLGKQVEKQGGIHGGIQSLSRKDGNISDKSTGYEMYLLVFGGVLPGTCSNYALKMTAIEN